MPPMFREAALPRRAVLLGGAGIATGAALVGCAAEPDPEPPAPVEPVPDPSPPEPAPAPEPIAPMPDVEAVIAAHEGRVPSQWGMEIPGVVRTAYDAGSATPERVFLSLDACGGPAGSGYDERLIAGLIALQVPATLFLNLHWIETNPALAESLAANPLFELGNHGSDHLPLSVTGRPPTASPARRACGMRRWRCGATTSR